MSKSNNTYFARDVYREWKMRIAEAGDSITVYTPFFDKSLLTLLSSGSLSNENIIIVTDLDPESILELPSQLLSMKRALSDGISLFTLPGLHAKVLLLDDCYVSVGSQNFTSRGRRNKECTSIPAENMNGTSFVEILTEWRDEAILIDEGLIDALISGLSPLITQHEKRIKEARFVFEEISTNYEADKTNAQDFMFEELEVQSKIRLSQGAAYASFKHLGYQYPSLVVDRGYDLTSWQIENSEGEIEPYGFEPLNFYPVILSNNYRMGFGRIAKTRITYIRYELVWAGNELKIDGHTFKVKITFPKTKTRERNIIVNLSYLDQRVCEVAFLFNGKSLEIVRKRYFKGEWHEKSVFFAIKELLQERFFNSAEPINEFFADFFQSFKYKEFGVHNKNIQQFLDGDRFRLSIIEFEGSPFLLIQKEF